MFTNFSGRFRGGFAFFDLIGILSILDIRHRFCDRDRFSYSLSVSMFCVCDHVIGSCHEISGGALSTSFLLSKMTTKG
jgi:hypothetical protein